ncbi:PREDICTED: synaptotagmin-5-like [Nicotiana attenuata]|uniref:synaptotagmin-5-like n=1 Tax=Nicotiana attenuata TaxID=49451 RepID=UPI000904B2C6|nr:PREDICTED: synaptotagmin-5-like [Nicotiana attenuata]
MGFRVSHTPRLRDSASSLSDLELKPVGILQVKLIEAKELTNKDIIGKSDPFNEHFEFIVEDIYIHSTFNNYDDEGIQAAEFIGCARIDLKDLEPSKVKDVWLKLLKDLDIQRDNKNRG